MVVDPSDFGVSESHNGGVDDTLNADSSDSGFVWSSDEPEPTTTTTQKNDGRTSVEPHTDTAPSDPFEWANTVSEDIHHQIHDGFDTSQDSQLNWSTRSIDESRADEPTPTPDDGALTTDDDGTPRSNMNSDSHGSVVSSVAAPATEDEESPERVVIDPIDYLVDELRTVADCENVDTIPLHEETEVHGFVWSEPPQQYRAHIEDPTPQQRQRLLAIADIEPERLGEKPYLVRISTEDAGAFITDWLEFLTTEAGTDGAIDALERYGEIGWMTEHVTTELKNEIRSREYHDGDGFETFDRGDHLLNFAYIAKISALSSEGMFFY